MAKNDTSKLWAFLAYLLGIIGFVLVLILKKKDAFAMYHAKQSLVLFIGSAVLMVAAQFVSFIPLVGWLAVSALQIGLLILWVMGIINALTGKTAPLPLIGGFGEKLKF